uniref:Uncharacterized protein n=1 Tax=Avena sativa TaxID=4498 RepID=A0ACD5ZFW7_AVESA
MAELQEPLVRGKRKTRLVDFLVQFRWIFVIFFLLPISALIYLNTYLSVMWSAMKSEKKRQKEHEENVRKVVKRLKQRNPKKDGLVCTARKPWIAVGMRNVDYKRARHFEVDLSAFRNILEIDADRMVAKVEPLVNMGQITRATCPMNLSIAVVSELEDLTVGGLINGYGIEGSSHIYGLFSDTVVAVEMVLADGRVVRATKDNEHSDLFYGVPWSQGTLGFLVSAEIKLIRIKEYMRLTYTPVRGSLKDIAQDYADAVAPTDPSKVTADFIEGLVFSETEGVMMTGSYASGEEARRKGNKINNVGWWFKPWFYQHVQTALRKGEFVEYIPTRQYYHRHTRSLFWECKLILPFADQLWFRYLLGWLMPPKVSLLKATQGEAIRNYYHDNHVIQDMLVAGFELNQRQGDTRYAQMFTDVGVYYTPACVFRGEEFDGALAVHRLEQWLIRNHGYETQYAVTELSEKDFWRMFDASHYELCRRKYGTVGTFMSVYYKSKKGRKSDREVREAEAAVLLETAGNAEEEEEED